MSNKEIVTIEEPNLVEFVKTIEKYVKDGYSVEDTNAGVPSQFGWGLYVCQVAKPVTKTETKPEPEPENVTTQEETETTRKSSPKRKTTRKKSSSNSE